MNLTPRELNLVSQALSYAVAGSNDESETADFMLLKVKCEGKLAGIAFKASKLCKSCERPLDPLAIIATGLCTACFTSNS